jgi:hypothetical protein
MDAGGSWQGLGGRWCDSGCVKREEKQFWICAVGHDLVWWLVGLGLRIGVDKSHDSGLEVSPVSPPAWVPPSMTLDDGDEYVSEESTT